VANYLDRVYYPLFQGIISISPKYKEKIYSENERFKLFTEFIQLMAKCAYNPIDLPLLVNHRSRAAVHQNDRFNPPKVLRSNHP